MLARNMLLHSGFFFNQACMLNDCNVSLQDIAFNESPVPGLNPKCIGIKYEAPWVGSTSLYLLALCSALL